ncbi:MAG: hypothetical protein PVJ86_02750 [Phycisphaerales bacterium]|jgi:hypothetical protein
MVGITDQYGGSAHFSYESQVYPTLTAGATVVSAAADWTYGAYAVVVPINTITSRYHIVSMTVESCDQNAVFQLALYKGAADDLVATTRFAVSGGFWGNSVYVMGSEPVEANAQLRARVASSDGLANQATLTISVAYHVF